VFVGVNYRLGGLGWLHRPGIVDAKPGASDIIAALSWVRVRIPVDREHGFRLIVNINSSRS
jgi:carboxylesterase type B